MTCVTQRPPMKAEAMLSATHYDSRRIWGDFAFVPSSHVGGGGRVIRAGDVGLQVPRVIAVSDERSPAQPGADAQPARKSWPAMDA